MPRLVFAFALAAQQIPHPRSPFLTRLPVNDVVVPLPVAENSFRPPLSSTTPEHVRTVDGQLRQIRLKCFYKTNAGRSHQNEDATKCRFLVVSALFVQHQPCKTQLHADS